MVGYNLQPPKEIRQYLQLASDWICWQPTQIGGPTNDC